MNTCVEVCASSDEESKQLLLQAIGALGGVGELHEIGAGLQRFELPGGEVTVYADAWRVDIAGPSAVVRDVLDKMAEL